jgi:hypothetical protein
LQSSASVTKFAMRPNETHSSALKRYIAKFNLESDTKRDFGCGPPCRLYRNLICLSEFGLIAKRITAAGTKEDIATANKSFKPFKDAVKDLVKMAVAASDRFATAMLEARKGLDADKTKSDSKKKNNSKKDAQKTKGPSYHEMAANLATAVETLTLEAYQTATELDHTIPLVISAADFLDPNGRIVERMEALDKRFKKDASYESPGRAQRVFPDDIGSSLDARFVEEKLVVDALPVPSTSEKLFDETKAVAFTVKKNLDTCGCEPGYLPSMRFGLRGNRSIVLVNFVAFSSFAESTVPGTGASARAVNHFFKTMGAETFKEYQTKGQIYACTVGPNDLMYVPAGYLFYESVANTDFVGARATFLRKVDACALSEIQRHFASIGKENVLAQAAADFLNSAA